jgi:phosphatidylserine/phosphatidylglycerophosphate/cardiolipin synthase-like enzyme
MKASASNDGLTVRLIAGTHVVLIAIDLAEEKRAGCLGFTIIKTTLTYKGAPIAAAQQKKYPLFTDLRFPKDPSDADGVPSTMDRSPLQGFRYGDYGAHPGETYQYQVIAQYGTWNHLQPGAIVQAQVTTEDQSSSNNSVFFNRGAAASLAYNREFNNIDPDKITDPVKQQQAYAWLSHGLEEAILAYVAQATDSTFGLHAAIYEFQKPNLLQGLQDAINRGVKVQVVYHHRRANPKDDTWSKNDAAIHAKGLEGLAAVCKPRQANPKDAISHNKFVVLLKDNNPVSVWTGSTNWTDGAIYGQLNVGHAIYDPSTAAIYDQYWQELYADAAHIPLTAGNAALSPIVAPPAIPAGPSITPIFSPQSNENMLDLYALICSQAKQLLVCAPFELAPQILDTFKTNPPANTAHFIMIDKDGSLGDAQSVRLIEGEADNEVSIAMTRPGPLHDFQNKLLAGHESYHHNGVHIHSKIIVADPLSDDPIIVTGSANFSNGSTLKNDENSLIIRGNTHAADIYTTEFMRMFDHYRIRDNENKPNAPKQVGLAEDDRWSAPFYDQTTKNPLIRQLFAGTVK